MHPSYICSIHCSLILLTEQVTYWVSKANSINFFCCFVFFLPSTFMLSYIQHEIFIFWCLFKQTSFHIMGFTAVDLLWLLIRPDINRKYCRTMSWMMYNRHGTIHAFGLIFYLYIHLLLCFFNPISIPMSLFWKYIYKKHFLVSRCTADFLLHRAFFIYGNITWFIYLIATIIWAFTLSYSWFLCLMYSFVPKFWIFVDSLEQSFWSYSLDIGCFFI